MFLIFFNSIAKNAKAKIDKFIFSRPFIKKKIIKSYICIANSAFLQLMIIKKFLVVKFSLINKKL